MRRHVDRTIAHRNHIHLGMTKLGAAGRTTFWRFLALGSVSRVRDQMALVTLSGATDPDGDTLTYHIDGVTQDEPVTGVGDDTSPDAALTAAGPDSNQVLVRSEANSRFNGRVYRIAYTVSDGHGGSCSGTAGPSGDTTAKVAILRKKGTVAIDDGGAASWDSFTGAPVP